jgi:hypothetical protein
MRKYKIVPDSVVRELSGRRDGLTYEQSDESRLNKQQLRVYQCMRDGNEWTLAQLAEATGDKEASISARIRDFRKSKFGGRTVVRRSYGGGLFTYQLAKDDE